MNVVTSRSCRSEGAVRVVRAGSWPDSCRELSRSSCITGRGEAAVRVVGTGGGGDSCRPHFLTSGQAQQQTGGQLTGEVELVFVREIERNTYDLDQHSQAERDN